VKDLDFDYGQVVVRQGKAGTQSPLDIIS